MPEGWEWDETLYRGSAPYYLQGRPPYAPGLAVTIEEALPAGRPRRLIDVGCGPGVVTLTLAHLFSEAISVDPDPGMLAEARRRAEDAGIRNVRWVQARAEELPLDLGVFTMACFAQSFHWMDRHRVAAIIHDMLEPDGIFVHLSDRKTPRADLGELPYPIPPYDAISDLVQRYLGPVRRAGQGVLRQGTPGDEAAMLQNADFVGPERIMILAIEPHLRSIDDVVAWVYSLSSSTPHLFGDERADFERELRTLLEQAAPEGRFADPPLDSECLIWRKASP